MSVSKLKNILIFHEHKYSYICICKTQTMLNIQELDSNRLEMAASMLKAIAHPVRVAVLKHLEGGKKLTVTEIHDLLGIEQSTTSHHLGILKDKGVLCSRREGKNTYYYLKHDILSQIVDCLQRCTCE
ncbi:MAG TPA: transcriptional regulator [Prolixibacteraceae bacterium]|nr:transcriptional regulator [Prolixibacteraceae bacterium]